MPRSGYDNTNCTNSEKQRTEGPLQTSTDTPRTVAGTIRIPRAFPLLGTDSNQPYSSTSRISIAPRPATAQLPSYTPSLPSISSIISAHRPYSVPFQENSTNIQSSPASTSANPTISPTPPLPRPSINRIALPTVRDQGVNRNRILGIEDLGGNALQHYIQGPVRESTEDLEPRRKVDERYAISPSDITLMQAAMISCSLNHPLRMLLARKVNRLTKDMPAQNYLALQPI
ncbi:hypothetical protein F5B22DRAFT_645490 [Xylaria bambusicola]|uniref:uncharacterized protein n=1 Tax=Xylaria bambusicola TaxID=326684 RepID=UPI00200840F2|nr:uncharacterized protein F5B22DRAFT_645490 [Xylaria bambusicola]KAI0517785.1 hypothetical protein F5B22DRAFT_645490 [Xylaria bambusicola]